MKRRAERLLHRGRIDVAALLIDPGLVGERAARERVLKTWTMRSRVLRLEGRYLVTLAPPVSMRTHEALGLPFVRSEQGLVASPEITAFPDVAAFFDASEIAEADLDVARRVDLTAWFDLSDFAVIEPESLGEPPPAPLRVVAASDVRDVLDVAAPTPERAALIRAIHGAEEPGAEPLPWWRRWAHALRTAFRAGSSDGGAASEEAPPERKSAWQRLRDRIDRAVVALTIASRLYRVFGRRQADYLRKLVDMLDSDDDEALRHAIPLAGDSTADTRPSFSVPNPRDDLRISPRGSGRGRAMMLGDDLYELLRARYRRLYERLVRQERIEEAAFVLAELLGAPEEAVQLLERHGRFVKAAELAEARGLAPGLVVRQWFLAKRYDRAVRYAKRHDAFGDAIVRLQRSDKGAADALRLLWADALADAGDFVAAVDTAWPVEEGRHLALPWIEAALAVGGAPGARMIVRALELLPDRYESLRGRALELLDDAAFDTAPVRDAFRGALTKATATPPLRVLARAALRSLYRDEALGAHTDAATYRALGRLSNDPVLEADRPHRSKRATASRPLDLQIDEADAGTSCLVDVAALPDGRFVVALGETGCAIVDRAGKISRHIDHPTERIIASDGGHRAILGARRGEVWRLARLDVARMRATHWCEARLTAAAETFDGWTWFVNTGSGLEAIDATARRFVSVWRNADCDALKIARSASSLAAATGNDEGAADVWRFELPSLTPRHRASVPRERAEYGIDAGGFLPNCDVIVVRRIDSGGEDEQTLARTFCLETIGPNGPVQHPIDLLPTTDSARLVATHEWTAVIATHALGCQVVVYDLARGERLASVMLQGTAECRARAYGNLLVLVDSRGRLVAIDVPKRRLLRSLRINL